MAVPSHDDIVAYLRQCYDAYAKHADSEICLVNSWDLTDEVNEIIKQIHPEIMKRYYGTGMFVPDILDGLKVIDIGCGSGSLVFVLSKLVGPTGKVVGVDISPVQIEVCKKYERFHQNLWGHENSNMEFYVEDTQDLSRFTDQSFDAAVSNSAALFAPDKPKAMKEIYRILKEGGEFGISDSFPERAFPKHLEYDLDAWESGVSCCDTIDKFVGLVTEAGFTRPHLTGASLVNKTEEYEQIAGDIRYCTANYRTFRLPESSHYMNTPSLVTYTGPKKYLRWDVNLTFQRGEAQNVDGHLADIIRNTDYKRVFHMEDATDTQVKNVTEDPFDYIDRQLAAGQPVHGIYTIGVY